MADKNIPDIFDGVKNWDLFDRREQRQEVIDGITVEVNVLFSKYKKHRFENDIFFMESLNSGKWKVIERDSTGSPTKFEGVPDEFLERVTDATISEIFFNRDVYKAISLGMFKKNSLQLFKKTDYTEFKKLCANVISRYIFYLVKGNFLQLVHSDPGIKKRLNDPRERKNKESDFMFIIDIMDGYKEGSMTVYDGTNSRVTGVNIQLSGAFLVGRIYFPYIYTEHTDATYLERTLVHELQHRMQDMAGIIKKEQNDLRRTARHMGDDPSTWEDWVSNVYTGIFGVFGEGAAVFIEKRNSTKIIFDLDKINYMKELMISMSLEQDKKKEAEIFDIKFSKDSHHGEYYLGYMMCYFIALTFLKRKGRLANVKIMKGIFSNEIEYIPFPKLNDYLSEHKSVKFAPLDPEIFNLAHQRLSTIRNYNEFIHVYEDACAELGLKEPVKFFSIGFVNILKNNYYKKTEYLRNK